MKKITLFFFLVFVYLSSSSYGQIGISENFNNGISDGWTGTFAATASQACSGQSVRSSIYEFNPSAELVSPNIIGVSNATDLTLSFDYKIVDWSLATNPTAEGWGNFTVDYSIDGGANWINIATVNDDNHITSAECATMTYVVPAADLPVNSDFQLRIDATWESGDYYLYFDNISALQVAEDVPDCDAVLTSPEDGAVNIPIEDSEISWSVATGIPTAYSLSVGTTPGGVDVLNNQNVGNVTSYDIGGVLEYETTYYVTIVPENEFGQALGCAEYTFTTEVDMTIPVDCNAGPVNTTFCYGEEDFEYIYQASDDNVVLNLDINSGQVEVFYDSVTVLDSDGSVIYEGDGDVAGMSFQSTGSSITLQVEGDNYNSCADGAYNPFDVSVSCSSCINPQASYAVVGDCENGSQFNVEVELTSLGDAVDVIIEDNQGESQLADVTGVYTFGPYSNGTLVDFAITSNQDPSCEITSSPITQEYCPVNYLECGVDPVNTVICYEDYEVVEVSYVTDDGSNMNLTVNSGDIYTFGGTFDVLDTNGDVLYSGYGNEGDLSGLEFQSTGDTITVVYTAGFYACEDIYTAIDITVECSTCLNPNLSYDVVSACENEVEQFFVEVTVNSLGSATSLTLTNNQDAAQENINEPTTFNFGPYPNGTEVVYTTVNDQDASCTVVSPVQTIDYCPQPPIIIDETKSVEELVDILINNPCSTVSNVTSSTGIDFGSVNGISYFDHNDSNFPLENGIVLSSGDVNDLPGPVGIGGVNTGWPGDPDLDNIISEIEGGLTDFNGANDASIIEFDFVPFVEEISFDFLFASDEYGIFQCDYSDPFGFFLTDSNGDTVNIAIVPGTTDPIAVTTVRDNTHNGSCASVNPSYFDVFYGTTGMNPLASPVNMLGRTVVMTASAQVTPGEQYHIKLAVGDRADSSYNSSTFLAAGSFELGEFTLGEDITIDDGTADTCSGDAITLDVGLENTNGADITWYQDGNLVEDANGDPVNTPTLEVTEDGEYAVSVIYFGSSCALSDVINVEFLPNPEVDLGEDIITICEGGATVIDGTPTNLSELDDVTYAWYLDGNEIAGETNATINVTEAGEYTVEVTGYQCTVSDSVVVEQVNYQVDFSNVSIGCTEEGDTNSFVLEPNIIGVLADEMNDLTYTWAPGGEQTSSITITEDGQYTVTVSYLGCFETATYNAEFTEAPQIDLGADAIVCSGATYSLDATPSNASGFDALTYSWLDADGVEVSTDAMPSLPGGTYMVTVTGEFANNGMPYTCEGTDQIIIEDVTYNIDLGGDQELCGMDPYTITATITDEDTTNATYQWSDSSGPIAGATGSSYTAMTDGTYTVEVTINGCADTASVDLLFDLSPQIDLGANVTTCDLVPYTIDATPVNMPASDVIYTWSLDGTELAAETGATLDPSAYGFGTYTVTAVSVNDSDGSCEVSASVVYTEAAIDLTITATQGETAITIPYCSDSEPVPSHTITFTASADGAPTGVNYQWYLDGTAIAGATDPSYTVTYEEEGVFIEDYSVEVSYDSCLFTSGSTPVDVTIEPYENGCVISQGISPSNVDGFNDCLDLTFLDDRTGIE
ncbi:choice-of-anchor L domain-containing protein, partial [Mesonia mobilis]|uniref:choice-of-anchor L domain-containing protein n=1 Tax=Mesonia mobilis TaxID=369791 RepID=UPI0026EA342E